MFGRRLIRSKQTRMPEAMPRGADPPHTGGRAAAPGFHLREVGSTPEDRHLLAGLLAHPPVWNNTIPTAEPPVDVAVAVQAMLRRPGALQRSPRGNALWVPGIVPPPFAQPELAKGGPVWDLPAFR